MEHVARFSMGMRGSGKTPTAYAAYISRTSLTDSRTGQTYTQSLKNGEQLVATDLIYPPGFAANIPAEKFWPWIDKQEDLVFTVRYPHAKDYAAKMIANAKVDQRMILDLWNGFSDEEAEKITRDFIAEQITPHGIAAQFAIHRDAEDNNLHVHVITNQRGLIVDRVSGLKAWPFQNDHNLGLWATARHEAITRIQNYELAKKGVDVRIAHGSFEDRGVEFKPTIHEGYWTRLKADEGITLDRARINLEAKAHNASLSPKVIARSVINQLTTNKATVTEDEITSALKDRYENDVDLILDTWREIRDGAALHVGQDARGRERFTSHAYAESETRMFASARMMAERNSAFIFDQARIERMLADPSKTGGRALNVEQADAVRAVFGERDLVLINGAPGVGKTTLLKAVKTEADAANYRIQGFALAGSAADKMQKESGIQSRTLASWIVNEDARDNLLAKAEKLGHLTPKMRAELDRLDAGRIKKGDVIIVDEGGMVGTAGYDRLLSAAAQVGARVTVLGDTEQFAAIDAGRAFQGLIEEFGAVEIAETLRHWGTDWTLVDGKRVLGEQGKAMRQATKDMRAGRMVEALSYYQDAGMIVWHDTKEQALDANVADFLDRYDRDPSATNQNYAFRRTDVVYLNTHTRAGMVERGAVAKVGVDFDGKTFAAGDRFLFLTNDHKGRMVMDLGKSDQALDWTAEADRRLGGGVSRAPQKTDAYQEWDRFYEARRFAKDAVSSFFYRMDGAPKGLLAAAGRGMVEMYFDRRKAELKQVQGGQHQHLQTGNEGVKNGTAGTVLAVTEDRIIVRIDPDEPGQPSRIVAFDPTQTNQRGEKIAFDYGYAATAHKSQGQSINGVSLLADGAAGSDFYTVGLSRHINEVRMHASRDEFSGGFADLCRAANRAPDKDLLKDYDPTKAEQRQRVRMLREIKDSYGIAMHEAGDKAKALGIEIYQLEEWESLAGMRKERDRLGEEILADFESHRGVLSGTGSRLNRRGIEEMLKRVERVRNDEQQAAYERVKAYADLNDAARDKWNSIKATHPGAESKNHPDYDAWLKMKEARDEAAFRLTTENGGRDVHRPQAAPAGANWKAIETQATLHEARQHAKVIAQTPAGSVVVAYQEARREVGRQFGVASGGSTDRAVKAKAALDPVYLAAVAERDEATMALAAKLKEAGIDPADLAGVVRASELRRSPEAALIRRYIEDRRLAGSMYGDIGDNDYSDAGRERARDAEEFADYGKARTRRNEAALVIADKIKTFGPWLQDLGVPEGMVVDDAEAARTGSRESARKWPPIKLAEPILNEVGGAAVDQMVDALKAAKVKPDQFAKDLAQAELRALHNTPEARLAREYDEARREAGIYMKLHKEMFGDQPVTAETRKALAGSDRYAEYKEPRDRRDGAVLEIAKEPDRYRRFLEAVGIDEQKLAADIKVAQTNVREQKPVAKVEQTAEQRQLHVPARDGEAAARLGQQPEPAPTPAVTKRANSPATQLQQIEQDDDEAREKASRLKLARIDAQAEERRRDNPREMLKLRIYHGVNRLLMSPELGETGSNVAASAPQQSALRALLDQARVEGRATEVMEAMDVLAQGVKPAKQALFGRIRSHVDRIIAPAREQAVIIELGASPEPDRSPNVQMEHDDGIGH